MGPAPSKQPDPICQANRELLEAARSGDIDSVERLLPIGPNYRGAGSANVHARHPGGFTALLAAAELGHDKVVQLLHKAGANHKAADDHSRSALILASMNNHVAVMQLLLGLGVDVNYTCKAGRTALMEAAAAGHVDSVKLLLK